MKVRSEKFIEEMKELDAQYRDKRNKIIHDYFFYLGESTDVPNWNTRMPMKKPKWRVAWGSFTHWVKTLWWELTDTGERY